MLLGSSLSITIHVHDIYYPLTQGVIIMKILTHKIFALYGSPLRDPLLTSGLSIIATTSGPPKGGLLMEMVS